MRTLFKPFVVQVMGDKSTSLIWATDIQDARAIYQQHSPENSAEAIICAPQTILLPEEMFEVELPHNLRGEIKETGDSYTPQFLVPNFLKRCRSAVIYARVSTPRQATNSSFSRQTEVCELFAQAAGLAVVQTYTEVESGGFYKSRPHLQSALDDLESCRAEVLLVESHDRLSRDTEASSDILSRVQSAHAHLVFVMEQVPASADSNLATHISQSLKTYRRDLAHEWGLME